MQRLVATGNWRRLTRTAVRAGLAAAATGAAVTLLIVVAGETIVSLIFGHAFVAVMPILILMGAGTSIRMLSFAADPVMYALGRPSAPLMISIASALMFIGIMLWRMPIDGLAGGGWAFVGMGVLGCALSGWAAWRMVRQERERTPAENG
jgi:O-antigen/teichoic acid export membrane protein